MMTRLINAMRHIVPLSLPHPRCGTYWFAGRWGFRGREANQHVWSKEVISSPFCSELLTAKYPSISFATFLPRFPPPLTSFLLTEKSFPLLSLLKSKMIFFPVTLTSFSSFTALKGKKEYRKFPVNYVDVKITLFCCAFSLPSPPCLPYVSKGSKWCVKSLKAEIKIRCKVLLIPLCKGTKTYSTSLSGSIFSKLPRCKTGNFYKEIFKVLLKVSNRIREASRNSH